MSHTIFVFILFIITVFLELLILYLFFEKIYRYAAGDKSGGGEGRDHSFSFLAGKIIIYLKWRLECRNGTESSGKYPYSEEMKTFLTANSDIHCELLGNLLLFISGIIIVGLVITIPAGVSGGFWIQTLFFAGGFSAFLEWWKNHRKYVIDFLVRLEVFLAEFEQQKLAEQKRKRTGKKADTHKIEDTSFIEKIKLILISIVIAIGGCIFLFRKIVNLFQMKTGRIDSEEFFFRENQMNLYGLIGSVFLLIVLFVFFKWFREELLENIKKHLNYYWKICEDKSMEKAIAKNIRGLVICPELADWEQKIRKMCSELKIKRALFMVTDQRGFNAETTMAEKRLPVIVCNEKFLKMLSERLGDMSASAICFLLGHELAHVYYKDVHDVGGLFRIFAVSVLICFGTVIGAAKTGNLLLLMTAFYASLLWVIFPLRLWNDERCRKQIMELRADRIGMQVSNTSAEIICALFDILESADKEEDINFLYQYYKGYIDVSEHISIEKRKREIVRGRKWCVAEYARYMFRIQINLILHKGWGL